MTTTNVVNSKLDVTRIVLLVLGLVISVLLLPFLIMNITFAVQAAVNPDEMPSVFGGTPLIEQGGAMAGESHIEIGDMVFVRRNVANAEVGDIVAAKTANGIVIRRLTAYNGTTYTLTGETGTNAAPIEVKELCGVYSFKLKGLGAVAMFSRTPIGMAICVGCPLLAYLVYDIVTKAMRKPTPEPEQTCSEVEAIEGIECPD